MSSSFRIKKHFASQFICYSISYLSWAKRENCKITVCLGGGNFHFEHGSFYERVKLENLRPCLQGENETDRVWDRSRLGSIPKFRRRLHGIDPKYIVFTLDRSQIGRHCFLGPFEWNAHAYYLCNQHKEITAKFIGRLRRKWLRI